MEWLCVDFDERSDQAGDREIGSRLNPHMRPKPKATRRRNHPKNWGDSGCRSKVARQRRKKKNDVSLPRSHFDRDGCDPPQWYGPTGE